MCLFVLCFSQCCVCICSYRTLDRSPYYLSTIADARSQTNNLFLDVVRAIPFGVSVNFKKYFSMIYLGRYLATAVYVKKILLLDLKINCQQKFKARKRATRRNENLKQFNNKICRLYKLFTIPRHE